MPKLRNSGGMAKFFTQKEQKKGEIIYLDGMHYHYPLIVIPLFIMTGISVLLDMGILTIAADITWLKASFLGVKSPKNKEYQSPLTSYKDSTLPL